MVFVFLVDRRVLVPDVLVTKGTKRHTKCTKGTDHKEIEVT